MFKEKQTILQYLFQEIKEEETVPNLFYEANTKDKDSTRNERGDVSTNFTEIKSIIRECHEQLYTNNSDN